MKKLKSFLAPLAMLLLILGGVSFVSCSNDDEVDEPAPIEKPSDGETTGKTLYLVGADPIGWSEVNEDYKMTQNGNVYTITVNGLPDSWKIWDGTWDYNFGKGDDNPSVGGDEVDAWFAGSSGNFGTSSNTSVKITFTLIEGSDEDASSIPSKIKIEQVD